VAVNAAASSRLVQPPEEAPPALGKRFRKGVGEGVPKAWADDRPIERFGAPPAVRFGGEGRRVLELPHAVLSQLAVRPAAWTASKVSELEQRPMSWPVSAWR
jgi:hypothetical protein